MEFCFKNTEEFVREFDRYYPLEKCECGGIREMELSTATVIIGERQLKFMIARSSFARSAGRN